MKANKTISFILFIVLMLKSAHAQDNTDAQQEAFDKKFRFGLRVNPQFTWVKSSDKYSAGDGASLSFGFGLMTEFRLSKIIGILTGIGADFDKYKIVYKATTEMNSIAVMDKEENYVEAEDGLTPEKFVLVDGRYQYMMKTRKLRTTFVTIPLQFKMNTQEFNGIRYFGIFGVDLSIRTKILANDEYASGVKTSVTGTVVSTSTVSGAELKRDNINLNKDASLIPMRLGLNLGAGLEYRLASSTALYFSVNYFLGFNSLLRNESRYLFKGNENYYNSNSNTYNFTPVKQQIVPNGLKINVGIFF